MTTVHGTSLPRSEIDSRTSPSSLSTTSHQPQIQMEKIERLLPSSNDQTSAASASLSPQLSARATPFFVPTRAGIEIRDCVPASSRLSRIRSLELPPLTILSKRSSSDCLSILQDALVPHKHSEIVREEVESKGDVVSVFRTSTVSEIEEWTLEDGKIALYKVDWHGSSYLSRQRTISIDSTSTLNSSLSSSTRSFSSTATGGSDDSITTLAEQDEEVEAEDEAFPLSAFESIQRELRENEHIYYREISSVCESNDGEEKQNMRVVESYAQKQAPRYIAKTSFPPPPVAQEPVEEAMYYPQHPEARSGPHYYYEQENCYQREIYDAPYPYGQFAVYPAPPPAPLEFYEPMPHPAYPTMSGAFFGPPHAPHFVFPPAAPYFLPLPPPSPPAHFHHPQPRRHASLGPSPNNKKGILYKTEMCRSWIENEGQCRYTSRCQFAHGWHELRDPNEKVKHGGGGKLRRVSC